LLQQSPDDPLLNFRYGEFLTEAGKPVDAIPVSCRQYTFSTTPYRHG
jgi:hypothetical protein